jgi:hypothetical protein
MQTGDRRVGQAQFFQYPVAVLEIRFADIGQAQAAGAPVQKRTPRSLSSLATALLTRDLETSSRRAASEKLLTLTTWAKNSMSLISCMKLTNCYRNGNSFVQKRWLIKRRFQLYHLGFQKWSSCLLNLMSNSLRIPRLTHSPWPLATLAYRPNAPPQFLDQTGASIVAVSIQLNVYCHDSTVWVPAI